MLLGDLRGGITRARIERCVFGNLLPGDRVATRGAARIEDAGIEVGPFAHSRRHDPVLRAVITTVAVDHHRRGQDKILDAAPRHSGQQHGRAVVVVGRVVGKILGVHAIADDGGLAAYDVDALEQLVKIGRTDVSDDKTVRHRGGLAVRLGQQGINTDNLVAGPGERRCDVQPDESGRTGQEDFHRRPLTAGRSGVSGRRRHGYTSNRRRARLLRPPCATLHEGARCDARTPRRHRPG